MNETSEKIQPVFPRLKSVSHAGFDVPEDQRDGVIWDSPKEIYKSMKSK